MKEYRRKLKTGTCSEVQRQRFLARRKKERKKWKRKKQELRWLTREHYDGAVKEAMDNLAKIVNEKNAFLAEKYHEVEAQNLIKVETLGKVGQIKDEVKAAFNKFWSAFEHYLKNLRWLNATQDPMPEDKQSEAFMLWRQREALRMDKNWNEGEYIAIKGLH